MRTRTDSQSAIGRLKEGPAARPDAVADTVRRRLCDLASRGTQLTLQWVPGHAGLPGNELADVVTRAAADLSQDEVLVDPQSGKARLRRSVQGLEILHRPRVLYVKNRSDVTFSAGNF